jgi:uncharacterized membrane protein YeaQ/YmgE (transglycosylase-associated protein family)
MLIYILALIVQGLILGALARLALPGRDPMSIPMTIGLGIAGSLIGGILVYVLSGGRSAGGFFVAFLFTVLLVYLVRRRRGGDFLSPDASAARQRGQRRY